MCFGVRQAAVTLLGVWRDQTSDFDRRSRWLSCGNTQEHMWTCGMKTSLGHWRHHLDSWMFYILHTITCGRMSQLARFRGTFCCVTCRNIWTIQYMVTFELPYAHDKRSQIVRQKRVSVLVVAKGDVTFSHCDTHYGDMCTGNMNVCAVCSESM